MTNWVFPIIAILLAVTAAYTTVIKARRATDAYASDVRIRLSTSASDVANEEPPKGEDAQHLQLAAEYHSQGLAQSRQSFYLSMAAAVIGFIVIIAGVVTVIVGGFDAAGAAGVQIVAGTVAEAVAVLFFAQSNRSRELMAEFFDKLRQDRKFTESLVLARDVSAGAARDTLHSGMALLLAEQDKDLAAQILAAIARTEHHTNHADQGVGEVAGLPGGGSDAQAHTARRNM